MVQSAPHRVGFCYGEHLGVFSPARATRGSSLALHRIPGGKALFSGLHQLLTLKLDHTLLPAIQPNYPVSVATSLWLQWVLFQESRSWL